MGRSPKLIGEGTVVGSATREGVIIGLVIGLEVGEGTMLGSVVGGLSNRSILVLVLVFIPENTLFLFGDLRFLGWGHDLGTII